MLKVYNKSWKKLSLSSHAHKLYSRTIRAVSLPRQLTQSQKFADGVSTVPVATCRFLNLPRELRDRIYRFSWKPKPQIDFQDAYEDIFYTRYVPHVAARCSNRYDEYKRTLPVGLPQQLRTNKISLIEGVEEFARNSKSVLCTKQFRHIPDTITPVQYSVSSHYNHNRWVSLRYSLNEDLSY